MTAPRTVSKLARRVLDVAACELAAGVSEHPLGSNRSPRIDEYVRSRDGELGSSWCGAFAAWCVTTAAHQLGLPDPLRGMGDLMSAYKWRTRAIEAGLWVAEPYPGMIGVRLDADLHGHVTIVRDYGCGIVGSYDGNHESRVADVERPLIAYTGFVDWERAHHATG